MGRQSCRGRYCMWTRIVDAMLGSREPVLAGAGCQAVQRTDHGPGPDCMASQANRPRRAIDAIRRRRPTIASSGTRSRASTPWRRKASSGGGSSLGSFFNQGGSGETTGGSSVGSGSSSVFRPFRRQEGRTGCGCGCLIAAIVVIVIVAVVIWLMGGLDLGAILGDFNLG